MTLALERRELLADLCMVAQGFRPPRSRFEELHASGLIWIKHVSPPAFGFLSNGRDELLRLLSCISGLETESAIGIAKELSPSVTEFDAGIASLDQLESDARSGNSLHVSLAQFAFVAWLTDQPKVDAG